MNSPEVGHGPVGSKRPEGTQYIISLFVFLSEIWFSANPPHISSLGEDWTHVMRYLLCILATYCQVMANEVTQHNTLLLIFCCLWCFPLNFSTLGLYFPNQLWTFSFLPHVLLSKRSRIISWINSSLKSCLLIVDIKTKIIQY